MTIPETAKSLGVIMVSHRDHSYSEHDAKLLKLVASRLDEVSVANRSL